MTKQQRDNYERENWLQAHGWDVETKIQSNAGSETTQHFLCKCIVVHHYRQQGMRVTTEATHGDRGEVDVLIHGEPDGAPFAVECETSPTQEVIDDKIDRYVMGSPLRECFVLNVSEMPSDMSEAYAWVEGQL